MPEAAARNEAVPTRSDRYVSRERLSAELLEAVSVYEGVTAGIVSKFVEMAVARGWLDGVRVAPEGIERFSLEALEVLVPAMQLWLLGAAETLIERAAADPAPVLSMMLDLHMACRSGPEVGDGEGGSDGEA